MPNKAMSTSNSAHRIGKKKILFFVVHCEYVFIHSIVVNDTQCHKEGVIGESKPIRNEVRIHIYVIIAIIIKMN